MILVSRSQAKYGLYCNHLPERLEIQMGEAMT
jgi:hypothetical protein